MCQLLEQQSADSDQHLHWLQAVHWPPKHNTALVWQTCPLTAESLHWFQQNNKCDKNSISILQCRIVNILSNLPENYWTFTNFTEFLEVFHPIKLWITSCAGGMLSAAGGATGAVLAGGACVWVTSAADINTNKLLITYRTNNVNGISKQIPVTPNKLCKVLHSLIYRFIY